MRLGRRQANDGKPRIAGNRVYCVAINFVFLLLLFAVWPLLLSLFASHAARDGAFGRSEAAAAGDTAPTTPPAVVVIVTFVVYIVLIVLVKVGHREHKPDIAVAWVLQRRHDRLQILRSNPSVRGVIVLAAVIGVAVLPVVSPKQRGRPAVWQVDVQRADMAAAITLSDIDRDLVRKRCAGARERNRMAK